MTCFKKTSKIGIENVIVEYMETAPAVTCASLPLSSAVETIARPVVLLRDVVNT